MDITIKIDDKRIHELISDAGSRYWARDLVFRGQLGFTLVEHADNSYTRHNVSAKMVRDGLTKMAHAKHDQGGHHFAAVLDFQSNDMYTGDAIIQFAIFGKLKYG